MRIISSFRDYYDSVQRVAFDKETVLVRERRVVEIGYDSELGRLRCAVNEHDFGPSLRFSPFLLGFCGRFYPYVRVEDQLEGESTLISDHDAYQAHRERIFARFLNPEWAEEGLATKAVARYYFQRFDVWEQHYGEYFRAYRAPYFGLGISGNGTATLELFPRLKPLGFARVKDPYSAFQEISSFLTGVLGRQAPETCEIGDDVRIAKHGFDKHSFRKRKKKKK